MMFRRACALAITAFAHFGWLTVAAIADSTCSGGTMFTGVHDPQVVGIQVKAGGSCRIHVVNRNRRMTRTYDFLRITRPATAGVAGIDDRYVAYKSTGRVGQDSFEVTIGTLRSPETPQGQLLKRDVKVTITP